MKKKNRLLSAILGLALAAGITGCGKPGLDSLKEDEPLVIEMYGSLDESYEPFLTALQEQFPDIKLQYEFQWDQAGVHEMERRILHEDGPDIAVVNGEALKSMSDKNLLLDLTNTSFSTRYHVSTMESLNDDGRVLGLPLPNDLRCFLCNTAILEEYGITQLPQTISELIEICRTLSEQGQGAVIMDDHIYQMLLRTSFLCSPEGFEWLQAYNDGKTAMAGTPAAAAWERFEELAAVSGCSPEDASAQPAKRTALMQEGEYAFRSVTISNLTYMQQADPNLEIIALPLLGETKDDQWAFYAEQHNMRYFVVNGVLGDKENEKKQEAVLHMLDWISTQEAQQLLASGGSASISYVNDVKLEQGDIMKYMNTAIERGHLTSSDKLGRGVADVITDSALKVLGGSMSSEEAVIACDRQNKEYIPLKEKAVSNEVIGTASAPIYWRKPAAVTVGAPMAQLAALAMAEAFPEADFSFAMAKNTASTLYAGDITVEDVLKCAEGEEDSELVLAEASGARIKTLIEAGLGTPIEPVFTKPYAVEGKGRLLHPAGLTYRADLKQAEGEKLTEIILADGSRLDMDKTYIIAVSGLLVDTVAEPNLKDCQVSLTGKYLKDVLEAYIRNHKEVSPPELGFEIEGASPVYTLP